MADVRRIKVVTLDDRTLEFQFQPKLLTKDLLDLVASHFLLKEKGYFGLSFKDSNSNVIWFDPERKITDYNIPKKPETVTLYFGVRCYIESITHLQDSGTIELFYLQAKLSIYKGDIEVDSETAFELAAYILQATHGDYTTEIKAKTQLKKLPVLPTKAIQEHPSLSYCESRILFHYRRLDGLTRGQAIVCYMQLIESLPTYGIHYYEVKDKSGIPWLLGLSYKGIGQYDRLDKVTPRKVFPWRQLQNIYFREKKFSIEVNDPKRGSVTKRTFSSSNVIVHAWYGSPVLIKSIWSMAINQHQFYLDRKHSKMQHPMSRSFSQIATDLTQSTPSITSHNSDMTSETSSSTNSLTIQKELKDNPINADMVAMSEKAEKDMVAALQARKAALEERLKSKQEEFKKMCLKEAEILGELQPDYPKEPGETLPVIRKKVGTAFALSAKLMNGSTEEDFSKELAQMEKEHEIQSNICKAALRLSCDPTLTKKSRKIRRENYKLALQKLEDIEAKLNEIRVEHGLEPLTSQVAKDAYNSLPRANKAKTPPVSRTQNIKGLKTKESERGRAKTTESKGVRARSKSMPRPHLNGGLTLPSPLRSRKRDSSLPRESTPGDIEFEDEDFSQPQQYSSQTLGRTPRSMHGLPPHKPNTGKLKVSPEYAEIGPPRQRSDSNSKPRSKTMVNQYIPASPSNSTARPVLRQSNSFRGSSSSNSDFSDTSSRKHSVPYDSSPQALSYNSLPRQKVSGINYSPSANHYSSEDEQPRIRQHASSMFNLQTQTQKSEFNYSDDGICYDEPKVRTQSPKKHGSVGNLRSDYAPPERLADETDQYRRSPAHMADYRLQHNRPRQPRYHDQSRQVYESHDANKAYSSDDQYSTGSGDRTTAYRGAYTNNMRYNQPQQYPRNMRDNQNRWDYYGGDHHEQYRGADPRNSPHSGRYHSPGQHYTGSHDSHLDYKENQYDYYQNGVSQPYTDTYYDMRHENPQYYHDNGDNSHYRGSSYDVRAAYTYHYQRQNSHEDYYSDRSSNYSDHSREYLDSGLSHSDRQVNYQQPTYHDQYVSSDPRLRNEYPQRNDYPVNQDYQPQNDYGAYQREPMVADSVYVQSHRTISVQQSIPEPQPAEFKTATTMLVRPTTTYSSNLVVSKTMYQPVARMTCEPVAPEPPVSHKSSSSSRINASPTPPPSSSEGSHLEEEPGSTLPTDAIDESSRKKGSSTLV